MQQNPYFRTLIFRILITASFKSHHLASFSMSISTASSSTPIANVNWTDLPFDIVGIIVHSFSDVIDFIKFGATCRTWRSVTLDHLRLRRCCRQNSSRIPWVLILRLRDEQPAPRLRDEQPARPTKKSRRMKHSLTSTVPCLRFYNFSTKKSYFINHPPHLMSDIDNGKVILIGSDNGYLIYNRNVHETLKDGYYFMKFHFYDHFKKRSSQNSILYLYNPVNGINFSLPPAPVFDRSKVIINRNRDSDIVTVAVICYSGNADDLNNHKVCIAIIRIGDSEWTILNLSKVITDDSIEDIIFHQDRLYVITYHLKTIVFDDINDSAKLVLCKLEETELRVETKYGYFDKVIERRLVESPDGKVLILYVASTTYMGPNEIRMTIKLFKHDWSQGRWELVKCAMDLDLSFFKSFDMLSVVRKSLSHNMATCTTSSDRFTGYDIADGCDKRLNIPDNVDPDPYICFIPNLS